MKEELRHDIVTILEKACDAMSQRDFRRLKKISEHTISNATVFQDNDSISIAVVMYAISKVAERIKKDSDYYARMRDLLYQMLATLKDGAVEQYHILNKDMIKLIAEVDKKLKLYVDEVMVKAQIKKSSSLYEHGISVARAAEILGTSQWELMSYIGKTRIHDFLASPKNVEGRVKFARSLFN